MSGAALLFLSLRRVFSGSVRFIPACVSFRRDPYPAPPAPASPSARFPLCLRVHGCPPLSDNSRVRILEKILL